MTRALAPLALVLALLAAPGARAQTLEHDSGLPIEITADSLEVVQEDQVATFAGNVDAVQGDLVLSADELRVYYRGDGESEPGGEGSIRRIEAIGHVFMSSPRETAQGEAGVYDVAGRQLTLEGSVVLTRDDNVIRGDRLEYDLATGRSRVVAAAVADGSNGAKPGERVRAIFTPGGEEPGGGARGTAPAARGGGTGGPEIEAQDGAAATGARPAPIPPAPKPARQE